MNFRQFDPFRFRFCLLGLAIALILPTAGQTVELPAPSKDGWESEAVHEKIDAQWRQLAQLEIDSVADKEVRVFPLLPENLEECYRSGKLTLFKAGSTPTDQKAETGSSALTRALSALLGRSDGNGDPSWKFKNISIHLKPDGIVDTRTLVELSSHDEKAATEIHMLWNCSWHISPDSELPSLLSIQSEHTAYREARSQGSALFEEVTAAVLRDAAEASAQFGEGFNLWSEKTTRFLGYNIYSRCGMAVGDANGDGLDDVYVCQPGGFPNRLLLQQPDGSVRDASAESGLDILNESASAIFVDLDNDLDQDVVIAARGIGLLLYRNEDGRHFKLAAELATPADIQSISSVDYDNDGFLDLYVCGYFNDEAVKTGQGLGSSFDGTEGSPNLLFRNLGETTPWKFRDATDSTGLGIGNTSLSLSASWEDFDDDGDQDLYVANDFGNNRLYRNDGAGFTEITTPAGVADFGAGMGVTWGDYDGDGRTDLYVANMFSSAGARITGQQKFADLTKGRSVSMENFRRFAKGNTLYRNLGDGTFKETSEEQEVEVARWAWSPLFGDVNNDGRQDLLVANGYITGDAPGDL